VQPVVLDELAPSVQAIAQEKFKRQEQQVCHWVYCEMETSSPASHPLFITKQEKQSAVFNISLISCAQHIVNDNPTILSREHTFVKKCMLPMKFLAL
jgi:hypothetical protein